MPIDIDRQDFAEVTVAEIRVSRMTHHDHGQLMDFVRGLLAADRRQVVLNLQQVQFVDSSALGEIVGASTMIRRAGGRMVLCHPTKQFESVLAIAKLQTVYVAYRSVSDAVDSFRALESLELSCPVCGGWFRTLPDAPFRRHFCAACRATVDLAVDAIGAEHVETARVVFIIIPTYDADVLTMSVDAAPVIKLPARLDLFSSEAVEKIWRLLPLRRRAIIDISEVEELSTPGMASLLQLGADERGGPHTAFFALPSANALIAQQFAMHVVVHTSPHSAAEALGLVGTDAPTITVSVRRPGQPITG
jgi:anti-sigma B factor antagonist